MQSVITSRNVPNSNHPCYNRVFGHYALRWYHFEPDYLPPYSPDFNPIERFWLRIKNGFFCRKGDELETRILAALAHFLDEPETVASQCRISENF